ncbi:MAG: NAD-dependent epimerase/dehydratase family protein [Polyangiaceae bacterium]|nr:NAD-dependent epimerase/dehydratase family protein [Polyangiaceae bacterium]
MTRTGDRSAEVVGKPADEGRLRPAESRRGRVVALTGAASFIGRNLIGILEEDPQIEKVVAIDVRAPETAGPKTQVFQIDLTAPGSADRVAEVLVNERVKTLVHMAFLSSPTPQVAWAHELESVGAMHLFQAARQAQLAKLVVWSQTILYGAHPENPNFLSERHPLRADMDEPFFADKIAAEREANAFAAKAKGTTVTILRTAPILGPTVQNYVTRYLTQRVVPTLLGFDPLWQFVHEVDAIAAFKLAIIRDFPGTFNIVGDGVLPLSTIVKLAGRRPVPMFTSAARLAVGALWTAQAGVAPPSFLRYLRYLCVADGAKAREVMGFVPAFTTREALVDFLGAQRLRDVNLLSDKPGATPSNESGSASA